MSLLTITKLTESVGAEVAGLSCGSTRRPKSHSVAGSAGSTIPRTVTTPSQGFTRSRWTRPRTPRPRT
jgi:hypothetical protein